MQHKNVGRGGSGQHKVAVCESSPPLAKKYSIDIGIAEIFLLEWGMFV